jgi:hypothetical protein
MNLFIFDENPYIAAIHYCNNHVKKIILEAAGCLCCAHWETGGRVLFTHPDAPKELITPYVRLQKNGKQKIVYRYRAESHRNNHVTKWVRESKSNYQWTAKHALALCKEFTRRNKKIHKTQRIIEWLYQNPPELPERATQFRQAVAQECKHKDVTIAYKLYYAFCKQHLAEWPQEPIWHKKLRYLIDQGHTINYIKQKIEEGRLQV